MVIKGQKYPSVIRGGGTWWQDMTATIPIFKIFSIIYQSLPYKYLRDYKGLLYQYFKSSANPIQIQIVIANLSAFDFKYSGIFLSSRNIGVLNAGILSISRNIGSAVAPPVPLPL